MIFHITIKLFHFELVEILRVYQLNKILIFIKSCYQSAVKILWLNNDLNAHSIWSTILKIEFYHLLNSRRTTNQLSDESTLRIDQSFLISTTAATTSLTTRNKRRKKSSQWIFNLLQITWSIRFISSKKEILYEKDIYLHIFDRFSCNSNSN